MMKEYKKIFSQNVLYQLWLKVPETLLSLITVPILVRYLTVDEFGIYSFVNSFIVLFSPIMDMGMTPIITREVSKDKKNGAVLIGNATLLRCFLFILYFFTVFVFSFFIKDKQKQFFVIILSLSYIFYPLGSIFSVFYSELKPWLVSLFLTTKKFLFLILIAIAIFINFGLSGVFISNIISENLAVFIFFWIALKFIKPVYKIDISKVSFIIKQSFPLFIIITLSIIYTKIDTIMLAFLCSNIEVGIYNGALQFYNFLFFIPGILTSFFLPLFSEYYGSNRLQELLDSVKYAFKVFTLISIFVAIMGFLLSKPVIIFLFSNKYTPSIEIFKILCLGIPFAFTNTLIGVILTSLNEQRSLLLPSLVSYLVNISLNIILIPSFRTDGAAYATVFTQFSYFLTLFLIYSKIKKQKLIGE